MKIAILDDYHGVAKDYADWASLGPQASVQVFREYLPEGPQRVSALQPFDVIVIMRERTPFPAELVNALPNLRLLVTTGLRNNSVDLAACKARGVVVCGAPGSDNGLNATAELSWTLILALFKNLCSEDANMRQGLWQTAMPVSLKGKRLGVVGLGKLGSALARVGRAFDMDVVAWSPNLTPERAEQGGARYVGKHELFSTADVISVHLILSASTRGVVDAASIAAMKPTAFLVNTSRAGLVDQDALMDALRNQRIGGAGLDVYPVEPLPADDPVRRLKNVVLTPHLGYVSADNFKAFYENALEAVKAWAAGSPIRTL
ncbi:D-2-hydroxyacid dehydrogenase family protein [Bordetella bronchialis]|uniref:Hydroxyacid dehydrogenase n=1 Tax=Bordetella bronchialis TaxID=463025 RepID=A0ABN4R6S5_9BORD|nr:D-2-hydroxyacid dehydrogenase family protein [Bordetella bronchialis]ANN68933.1 hydroxyacid dehydrogenase [Bordetella bronchialis]